MPASRPTSSRRGTSARRRGCRRSSSRRRMRGAQLAWRTPTQSLPQEVNPRNVFYRLFGQGDDEAERAAIVQETGSILDRVHGAGRGLAEQARRHGSRGRRRVPRLGARDRAPRADGGDSGHERARHPRGADRRAERPRRALRADVRLDGARVPGRSHARHHVLDGSRSEHAHVQQLEHLGGVPPALASRERSRRSRTASP